MDKIESKSDKALLYMVRDDGNLPALAMLSKRFGYPIADDKAVMSAIKRMKVPSVNAVRRIIAANAGIASHGGSLVVVA